MLTNTAGNDVLLPTARVQHVGSTYSARTLAYSKGWKITFNALILEKKKEAVICVTGLNFFNIQK